MKKKVCILLALMMSLLIVACGGTNDGNENMNGSSRNAQNEDNNGGTAESIKITILNNKIEIEDGLKHAAEIYSELNPEVTFEIVSLTADPYNAELKTRFAGGEEPDIFAINGYSDMVLWQDKLEDLSDQSWVEDMMDFAYSNIQLDGIYGMPLCVEGGAYMYNKDMFAEAGIYELPRTFTELENCLEKLKSAGYTALVEDGEYYGRAYYCINYIIAMQDDPMDFIDGLNDGSASFAGAPLANDIMDYWKWEFDQIDNMLSIDFLTQVSMFANGEAAITFGGNWNQTSLDEINPELNVGMFPVPIFEDAEQNDFMLASVTTYWGVNKNSASKEAAKDFMEWLVTDEEGQQCMTDEMLLIPAFENFSASDEKIGALGRDLLTYISAGKVKNFYGPFYPEGGLQTFGEDMQKMLAGRCTIDELLVALDQDWQRLSK